jgi:hypothetical protein
MDEASFPLVRATVRRSASPLHPGERLPRRLRHRVLIILFDHSIGRDIGLQRDRGVARVLPDRDCWRRELWVGEIAHSDADAAWKRLMLKVHGRAEDRTEMECERAAAFACPLPRRRLAVDGDLFAAELRLIAHYGAGAALALQAVAQRSARVRHQS